MILVLDNYDSFVHNLARLVRLAGAETLVVRSDAIDVDEIERLQPEAVVLSPGPGAPDDAGCCIEVVRRFHERLPVLGVCLGHQAIARAFGGEIVRAPEPMHGRASAVRHTGEGLFDGAPSPVTVCRYHSLAIDESTLPPELSATAWSDDGVVMAIEHRRLPVYGVQFHPEAVLTDGGLPLLERFVEVSRRLSVTNPT